MRCQKKMAMRMLMLMRASQATPTDAESHKNIRGMKLLPARSAAAADGFQMPCRERAAFRRYGARRRSKSSLKLIIFAACLFAFSFDCATIHILLRHCRYAEAIASVAS